MRTAVYACLAVLFTQQAAANMHEEKPEPMVWNTASDFQFASKPTKTRKSLSGIACPSETTVPRRCVAAFDEGGEARYVTIEGLRFTPDPQPIVLLPGKHELDAEGAAHDGAFVYVTGSHSRKRDGCRVNEDSRHVFRLPVTADGSVGAPVDDQGRLWTLMLADTVLGPFVDKCLGKDGHGVNIEGLAVRDGQLYFGFREPAKDRTAYILRVAARPLFESGDPAPKRFTIPDIGKASGIRDMLAVKEGLLVLVGPDDDSQDVPYWIGFWDLTDTDGNIKLRPLAELLLPKLIADDCHEEIKPEAMTLLADEPNHRRILILSDGLCDGGPMSFRIPK